MGPLGLCCLCAQPLLAEEPGETLPPSSLRLKLDALVRAKPWVLFQTPAGGGVYPSLGGVAEGSGFAPGLTYWNPRFQGSGVDVFASGSRASSGDGMLELRIGRIPHRPGRPPSRNLPLERLTPYPFEDGPAPRPFFLYAEARARRLGERRVFEAGGTSRTFSLEDQSYDLVAGYRLAPGLVASVRAGWLSALTQPGGPVPAEGLDLARGELGLAFDRRDSAERPSRGIYLQASWGHYAGVGAPRLRFDRVSFDARGFVPLGSPRDVLALRGLVSADVGGDASGVPSFLQETLGGSATLRGYESFRVRGPRLAAFGVEYRRRLGAAVEAVGFYDAGTAFGPGAAVAGRLFSSAGAGLRLRLGEGPMLRLDVARGSEGTRLSLRFGHAF
jgi:hypothetical protein